MLIDSHCHLDSFARAGTLPDVLARADDAGVPEIICVGTDVSDWGLYRNLAHDYAGKIHYTVGLHPCHVDEAWHDQVAALTPWFADSVLPVALGEIGLDNFHLPKDPDEAAAVKSYQEAAFRAQLEIAFQLDCTVVIHSRNAFPDCMRMIDASGVDWKKIVFHCFSEGADEMREINRRGGRGSFTGVLTYPKAENVRQAALAQGLERFMLETDSPYLSPQPVRGKPNEPALMRHTAEAAAKLFGVSFEELAKISEKNTRAFFGI